MRINLARCKQTQYNNKTKMANATRARVDSFVWTELLLRVTLDYKSTKLQENVDWESCQSKYSDIMEAFQAQYSQLRRFSLTMLTWSQKPKSPAS